MCKLHNKNFVLDHLDSELWESNLLLFDVNCQMVYHILRNSSTKCPECHRWLTCILLFQPHFYRESQTSFLHNQWGFQPVRQSARIWSVNSVLSCWHFRQLLSIRSVPAFLNAYRNKAVPCSAYLTQDFVAFHEKQLNAHDFFLES